MKKLFLIIIILFIVINSYGQGYYNNWFFGYNAGINFNTSPPTAITGQTHTGWGSATISDYNGNLLFYTDGGTVWNKNHMVMPNGTGIMGYFSRTQSALIVPNPGNVNQYYIFCTPLYTTDPFTYSIVDMTLDGGLGNVTSVKNFVLHSNSTERATAVRLPDSSGFWIIGHEHGNNTFFAYKLTASGIDSNPVLSKLGKVQLDSNQFSGYLKPSHSGNKLAMAIWWSAEYELFDFNRISGIVSNKLTIPCIWFGAFGLEFSFDDKLLYICGDLYPHSSWLSVSG